MPTKKPALGKVFDDLGLTELLPGDNGAIVYDDMDDSANKLAIENLLPGKYQPRRNIKTEDLQDLATSIKKQGVIQPIIVRPGKGEREGKYEIIAGERRWRASKMAGLTEVPVVIRAFTDEQALAIGLIENIQRRDLNVVEEAMALKRLIEEFSMTHEQVAESVGKSRSTITNLIRLLNLDKEVLQYLEEGQLEMGHARALLALEGEQQLRIAAKVVEKGLSVRQTELYIQQVQQLTGGSKEPSAEPNPKILEAQSQLTEYFGSKVQIKQNQKGKGKFIIEFKNQQQFDEILDQINLAENIS